MFTYFEGIEETNVNLIVEDDINQSFIEYNDDNDGEDDNTLSNISIFLKNIKLIYRENSQIKGDRLFAYYQSGLSNAILKIFKYFPLWTNVMQSFFNSPYNKTTGTQVYYLLCCFLDLIN